MSKKPPLLTGSKHKRPLTVTQPNALLSEFADKLNDLTMVLCEHGVGGQLTIKVLWQTAAALGIGPDGGGIATAAGPVAIEVVNADVLKRIAKIEELARAGTVTPAMLDELRIEDRPHNFRQDLSRRFKGPPSETCELCGRDPRNTVHRLSSTRQVSQAEIGAEVDRLTRAGKRVTGVTVSGPYAEVQWEEP